ncbi:MAG: hypothetical protein DRI24_02835 [Deltaproteobacteria bacterium]|nr:MAG: hypothetical protein DRI24_02835 [Deltaproteobacteria bacterium]
MVVSNRSDANVYDVNLVGGNVCLDFTNTLYWRGRKDCEELIKTYSDFINWSLRVKLINSDQAEQLQQKASEYPEKAEKIRLRAIKLREVIFRIFNLHSEHLDVDEEDLDRLNFEWGRRMITSKLVQDPNGFHWNLNGNEESMDWILTPILVSGIELLTSKDIRRVKRCADSDCSWLFFDQSRNRSRRWCDMKDCGNRAKVNRFFKRRRSDTV